MRPHRFAPTRRGALQLFTTIAVAGWAARGFAQEEPQADDLGLEPDNLVTPISAKYQALSSYADTGTVETRYQWPDTPLIVEHHTFSTAFRAPRNFFFRFDADPASGGDAYVIWCDGGSFQSWWKATGEHTIYDNGQGATAFLTGQSPTHDAANLVAPHFFPQAELVGPTYRLIAPEAGPAETVGAKNCSTIMASSRVTGTQTQEHRPIKIWVDDQLGLFRQVHVGPEEGGPPKLVDEITYLIEPQANPNLADDRFTFDPPQA